MFKEFRDFIMTGNVVDLAVAVILAGAVGLVVTGFTNDIVMPIVGAATGGVDFADKMIVLNPAVYGPDGVEITPVNAIRYGAWINSIINLILVGFVLFLIVKAYNRVRTPVVVADPAPTKEETLLAEIRDLLARGR